MSQTTLLQDAFSQENPGQERSLSAIAVLDNALMSRFERRLIVDPALNRQMVSFQANKSRPAYRWYKYKEAYSAELVEYLLARYNLNAGTLLDPFAGSGTTLFAATRLGLHADGIELLPIGQQIIATRDLLEHDCSDAAIAVIHHWMETEPWRNTEADVSLQELRITKDAYSAATHDAIECYMTAAQRESSCAQTILRFALLCVLEEISFTRKDGQYLRWDYRSGRRQGKKSFDKGQIQEFASAIRAKLTEITQDHTEGAVQGSLFASAQTTTGRIRLLNGSCLHIMPQLLAGSYDALMTSPPYCNRYDYTRTYALELALLGTDEHKLSALRQEMLSCTVENRAKDLLHMNPAWENAIKVADNQRLLQAILTYLNRQRELGLLNNTGIPRMVRGYFYEMACVIAESARLLKSNAPLFMVNDNVRYAGVSISVDLILSDMAESLGFIVDKVLVLPNGKGNSSQQMGQHGRETLRKCVYIWRKA
ncbi:MAG: site-specific DNA-methyltransferase [Caldilineaceae bacterium]|jgi:DNA modification methylase|nr:site-specific DNA-methyltransferase [Caldilineaceae bacterium]